MKLQAAIDRIESCFSKMDAAYLRPVFDEIAIVALSGTELVLHHYQGPRKEAFMAEFADASVKLRKELRADRSLKPGDFSFTREGEGAAMDASICLGEMIYLFCNHTEKSMTEITSDPRWLDAQGEFLNASQYFAVDPLVLEA